MQARPRFRGHWQPHLPADLGFVDLRSREVLAEQAVLAATFGITGFVMYHYWFGGRRLLERPVESILSDSSWPGRFCLCWANETWSRVWDGREDEVLIRQEYGDEDDSCHAEEVSRIMADPRYIRLGGRPLFLVYRPGSHPSFAGFCQALTRRVLEGIGSAPLIFGVRSAFDASLQPPWTEIVDGVVGFQPNRHDFALANRSSWLMEQLRRGMPASVYQWLKRHGSTVKKVDYKRTVARIASSWREATRLEYPCVFPNWDNTPRRKTPIVIQCDDPSDFGLLTREAVRYLKDAGAAQGPLFVNAWNEWAEGCHLEPDLRHGRAFLAELAAAVGAPAPPRP